MVGIVDSMVDPYLLKMIRTVSYLFSKTDFD
jgi:hypothetical protein